jgi:hypothetical protein
MTGPVAIQRFEGIAVFGVGLVVHALSGRSWWLFAALLLVPDLSMAGYLAGPRLGATVYNLGHTLIWPVILVALAVSGDRPLLASLGGIWLAHIGMDRALGFGLKHPEGFAHTHLGVIGRRPD